MPKTRPDGRAASAPAEVVEEVYDGNLKRSAVIGDAALPPAPALAPAPSPSPTGTVADPAPTAQAADPAPKSPRSRKAKPPLAPSKADVAAAEAAAVAATAAVAEAAARAAAGKLPDRTGRFVHSLARSIGAGLRRNAGVLVSVAVAAVVLLAAVTLGPADSSNTILVGLGFDPDRAQLITALIVGGAVAVISCLAGGVRWAAVPLGFAAMVALFASTFATETQNALAATGATGTFAPFGWTQTLLAFVAVGLLTAWACATCALPVRRELGLTFESGIAAARERPFNRRSWTRVGATVLIAALLAVTVPLAGDMFNFGADERMVVGGPPRQGLVPDDQGGPGQVNPSLDPGVEVSIEPDGSMPAVSSSSGPSSGQTATGAASPTGSPGPTRRPTPSMMPNPSVPPWRQSPPAGQGRMLYLAFNAPWVDPGDATEEVAVYLPPGYDTNETKRYPAIYEAPFLFNVWNAAFHVKSTLDSLINDGQIPPSLVMFMNAGGGPYADTQCADTFDGREKMDRFMAISVPAYIDKHYRTIPNAAARAVMGMSEGGYCAAILALHHPDVFGSALSFSGYFTAGIGTASAPIPFGGNATLLANDSPTYVAPKLDAEAQLNLYFVIVAQGSQVFYGTQANGFMQILDGTLIKYSFIDAEDPHGWPQVRSTFSQALTLVANWQAAQGVFK